MHVLLVEPVYDSQYQPLRLGPMVRIGSNPRKQVMVTLEMAMLIQDLKPYEQSQNLR